MHLVHLWGVCYIYISRVFMINVMKLLTSVQYKSPFWPVLRCWKVLMCWLREASVSVCCWPALNKNWRMNAWVLKLASVICIRVSQYISLLVNEAQYDLSSLMIELTAIFPQSPLAFYNKSIADDWLFFLAKAHRSIRGLSMCPHATTLNLLLLCFSHGCLGFG